MSTYKLVTLDPIYIAEQIARTGSEELLTKASRNYVGLYDDNQNWYIPLRANLNKRKPPGSYYETVFENHNPHLKRPGLDYQKALYIPQEKVIEIENTLPHSQAVLIEKESAHISKAFEDYVLSLEGLKKDSFAYLMSTVPLFPEGIQKIKALHSEEPPLSEERSFRQELPQNSSRPSIQTHPQSSSLNMEQVRSTAILDVAQALGMEMKRTGQDAYSWVEHDSLVISPSKNVFSWFSQDISGDAISLVQAIRHVSFKEAAYFIQEGKFGTFEQKEQPKEPFVYTLERYENPQFKEANDYLTQVRGLSQETIDFFRSQGVLAQATLKTADTLEPVIVFKSLDFDGQLVGTSMQGIEEHPDLYTRGRLKRIGYHSDGQAGLSVTIGEPKHLIFMESPIDLMSYYETHKETLTDVRLISMDGLKKATIGRYLADLMTDGKYSQTATPQGSKFLDTLTTTTYFEEHPDVLTLAVDNDEAGRAFIEKLQHGNIPVIADLPPLSDDQEKVDWNDALKEQKRKEMANEQMTLDINLGNLSGDKENHDYRKYYPIDEAMAKRAKNANSFSDYENGSATIEYRQLVDKATEIAEKQKEDVDERFHEKIDSLLQSYSKQLAANLNQSYAIEARMPSVLIVGAGNFSSQKKEKQNASRKKNLDEWTNIQKIPEQIQSIGKGGISADDPEAVSKLQAQLTELTEAHKRKKSINAYYKKHNTLEGCPELNSEDAKSLSEYTIELGRVPYSHAELSNETSNIHRIEGRIKQLNQRKASPSTGWKFEGGEVKENTLNNRLQVLFDDKPDAELRADLKSHGFRWSPKENAWQRQLTNNALFSAKHLSYLQPVPQVEIIEKQQSPQKDETVAPSGEPKVSEETPHANHSQSPSLDELLKDKNMNGLAAHMKKGLSDYTHSDMYKQYLDFQAKMPTYSSNNIQLLMKQKKALKEVASFGKWKQLNRFVKKGERALKIYAPIPPHPLLNEKTGKALLDKEGKPRMSPLRFKLASVFDVSQTEGQSIPKQVNELTGSPKDYKDLFMSLSTSSDAKVSLESIEVNGFYSPDQNLIKINSGMSPAQTIKTLIHELTHRELHANSQAPFGTPTYAQHEFEAESVAYVMSAHYGIDASEYSFGYLKNWGLDEKSMDQLKETMATVQKTASAMIQKVDQRLEVLKLDGPKNSLEKTIDRFKEKQAALSQSGKQEVSSQTKKLAPL